jgi:tRNA/rRNA methyltransferase
MDIDSEGTADQRRNLDLYQFLQFHRNQPWRSHELVHPARILQQFRVMGAQAGTQRDAAQTPAYQVEDEPGFQAQIAIGDSNASCHMNPAYDGEIETSSTSVPHLAVILVDVRNPLNIGAAARAMANFGFSDLRLVNPYEPSFREAVSAVGGAHVLRSARVFPGLTEALADCSLVVGTSAGTRRIAQQPLERLDAACRSFKNHPGSVALLFGSEKFGLSNDDLSFCHLLARIPTLPETPSMNLGQAVAVCLYELVREQAGPWQPDPSNRSTRFEPVDGLQAEQITAMLLDVLDESGYTNRITAVSTTQKIRRWVRRTRLSRRDGPLVLGILRQILWKFRQG